MVKQKRNSFEYKSICFLVRYGISKLDNKQPAFKDTQVMLCHFHYRPI